MDGMLLGMKLLPWKCFLINSEQYLRKFSTTSDSYCLILSDMNAMYVEYLSSKEIKHKFEELNPSMEMPLYRILALLEKIIPNSEENEISDTLSLVKNGNKDFLLRSETTVAGIPFIWQFRPIECDKKLFKEQLLRPLIGMIAELQQRQDILISLIKKKDIEIEDYQKAGAVVSKKYLKTSRFDESQFIIDRMCPQLLSETTRNSVSRIFNEANEEFYVAVATTDTLIEEEKYKKLLEDDKLIVTKNELDGKTDSNHHSSISQETDEDKEIAKRKELEEKLTTKPAKRKKKKITF